MPRNLKVSTISTSELLMTREIMSGGVCRKSIIISFVFFTLSSKLFRRFSLRIDHKRILRIDLARIFLLFIILIRSFIL